jgi:hypothetical protein
VSNAPAACGLHVTGLFFPRIGHAPRLRSK